MPMPSTMPMMPSTTQDIAARSDRLSQPRETSHHATHPKSATSSPTPSPPRALNAW